jgi:hypothetical protein
MKIILIPEAPLFLGVCGIHSSGYVLDGITISGYQAYGSFRVKRSDDTRCSSAPVVSGEHCPVYRQGVEQSKQVRSHRRLLAGANGCW